MQRRSILRLLAGLSGLAVPAIALPGLKLRVAAAATPVHLGIGEWPPYFSQSLKHQGSFAYIVNEAFAAAGYDVVYSFLPWKRALQEAASGELDGSPGWKSTPERAASFLFSDPVITSTSVFFHTTWAPFSWKNLDDLKGLRIAVAAGYSYGANFDAAVAEKRLTVDVAKDDITGFRMLIDKHVDLVLVNRDVGHDILRRQLAPDDAAFITEDPMPVDEQPSFLAISKKAPHADQLLDDFNRGLATVREQGLLDRVQRDLASGQFY